MRVLIVVDSGCGGTRKLAEAVAAGLLPHDVLVEDVAGPAPGPDVDLVVVGGHRLDPPLAAWLSGLARVEWVSAAAFETRPEAQRPLTGSTGHRIGQQLRQAGYRLVTAPESFRVDGPDEAARLPGEGELDRARAWGAELSALLTSR
jgi:hypothetical protein